MTLASRVLERLFRLPPAETHDVLVERDLRIPMPDGVALLADRYAPRGKSGLPTVLARSPYGRDVPWGLLFGRLFAERGFQAVVQSCRGTFGSGGELDPFASEREDGLATLAWLKEQPWFNGTLGTVGPSYLGFVQWAIARDAGPALKAMALQVTTSDFRGQTYAGEAFTLDTALSWARLVAQQESPFLNRLGDMLPGTPPALRRAFDHLPLGEADVIACGKPMPFFRAWLEHNQPGDPYWERRVHSETVGEVSAPISMIAGWYDIFLPWQLADYAALRAAGREPQITIGPWSHADQENFAVSLREAIAWLRAHLLGDRSLLREAPVRIFVMGAGEWREYPAWPPPGAREQRWHLHAGGRLAPEAPAQSAPDRYRYDPADPTPAVGGPLLLRGSGMLDNQALEARRDVLLYTSAELPRDLDVIGPVRAELFVRSSLEHTDFFARLCDVDPAGVSRNVCDHLFRVSPGRPDPEPDGSLRVAFDLFPTAYRFRRGHRLRLQVSSGAHPRFARNPGTGELLATATRLVAAEQQVLHDPQHPSAVILSIEG